MKKIHVVILGVWDLLHVGHIKALERASKLGDVLIVGIEDDEAVKTSKGVYPVIPLKDRITALESLKMVDIVVPYTYRDYSSIVENFEADVLCLSEEYKGARRFNSVIDDLRNIKMRVIYLPYYKGASTSKIKEKIKNGELEDKIKERIAKQSTLDLGPM